MAGPMRVLITRPAHQAEALVAGVTRLGHTPLRCPAIVIEPVKNPPQKDESLRTCDIAIFVSLNAVRQADRLGLLQKITESSAKVLAIGPATARALAAHRVEVEPLNGGQFDSENLLKHPALQALSTSQVVLVRGKGGRDLIANTLRNRGATLTEHIVYQRRAPTDTEFEHSRALVQSADIILCGSDEALDNLVTLVGDSIRPRLLSTALIVNSARGRLHALSQGFSGPIHVAEPAGDDGQLSALARFAL